MTLSEGAEGSEEKFRLAEREADSAGKADPAGGRENRLAGSQGHIGRTAFSVKNYVGNRFLNSAGYIRFQARCENEGVRLWLGVSLLKISLLTLMKQVRRGDL